MGDSWVIPTPIPALQQEALIEQKFKPFCLLFQEITPGDSFCDVINGAQCTCIVINSRVRWDAEFSNLGVLIKTKGFFAYLKLTYLEAYKNWAAL